MGGLLNVVLAGVVAGLAIAGSSIAWPKFTSSPRPAPIQQVYDSVKKTPYGQSFANVLGVSDSAPSDPVNVASEASKLGEDILKSAQARATTIIVTQAVRQLVGQFDQLPQDQQTQIRQLLCQPTSTPGP